MFRAGGSSSMKHTRRQKFSLNRETIRRLSETLLADAVGAGTIVTRQTSCFHTGCCARRGTGPVDSCEGCTVTGDA
jgi:hypothetical protein